MGLNDSPPLAPAHFLCGHRLMTLPDHTPKDQQDKPSSRKRWSSQVCKCEDITRERTYEAHRKALSS